MCFQLKQLKVSARNKKIGVLHYASVASSFPTTGDICTTKISTGEIFQSASNR